MKLAGTPLDGTPIVPIHLQARGFVSGIVDCSVDRSEVGSGRVSIGGVDSAGEDIRDEDGLGGAMSDITGAVPLLTDEVRDAGVLQTLRVKLIVTVTCSQVAAKSSAVVIRVVFYRVYDFI